MMAWKSANIYSSSQGFFYVSKLLGLAPYSFDPKKLKFNVNFVNYLQFSASLAFWVILTSIEHVSKVRDLYKTGIQSNLLEHLWMCQYTLQHYLATGVVIYSFTKRKHVENFLSLIYSFDQHLENLHWKVQPKQNSVWFAVILFVLSTTVMIIYTVTILALDKYNTYLNEVQIFRLLNYIVINDFFLLLSIQFISSVYCIDQRLIVLTENFR